jgi:predicted transcriptional regulator of viral defense system
MKILDTYIKLKNTKKDTFTTQDIRNLLDINNSRYLIILISRMLKKGLLISIKRGLYYIKDETPSDFSIANSIYNPSYISLDTALAYYGIVNQSPFTITSISTKEAKAFIFNNKEYKYSKIKTSLFYTDNKNIEFNIASKEKTIIDSIYFASLRGNDLNYDEWDLSEIDIKKLKQIASTVNSKPFNKLFNNIIT